MRRHVGIIALLAAILAGLPSGAASALGATSASANIPNCPARPVHDWTGGTWEPSAQDVFGVRAPVEARKDGQVCANGQREAGHADAWIAITDNDSNGITQAGIIHIYNPSLGRGQWCEFWAIGTGHDHIYNCHVTNNTYYYFEIVRYEDSTFHTFFYKILDCGTKGGYGKCKKLNDTQPAYKASTGNALAESSYSQHCVISLMGDASNQTKYGTSRFPLQVMSSSLKWTRHKFAHFAPQCNDYFGDPSAGGIGTYDGRNSS